MRQKIQAKNLRKGTPAVSIERLLSACVLLCMAMVVRAEIPEPLRVAKANHIPHAYELVVAALREGGMDVPLEFGPDGNEHRLLHLMANGQMHIAMVPVSAERLRMVRDGRMLMVPVPLDRGLLGHRIGLTVKGHEDRLANVRTLEDLQQHIIGQGEGWSDLEIYRHAGIPVREIKDWNTDMFARQIETGTMDLYPMGVEETQNYFLDYYRDLDPDVTIEPNLLIRYPFFRLVWVAPQYPEVQEALERGFAKLIESGEFTEIWERHRKRPDAAFFDGRTVIELDNPHYNVDIIPDEWRHLLISPEELE